MAESVDDFIAGWFSGAVATLATQPIDLATTRLQSGNAQPLRTLLRRLDSLPVLWRGTWPLIAVTPLSNALMFLGYGAGKRAAERVDGSSSIAPIFIAGCVGGFAQSFIQSPAELLKIRMQLALEPGRSSLTTSAVVSQLMHPSGHTHDAPQMPSSQLSRGLVATIGRDVLPHGIWFAAYHVTREKLSQRAAERGEKLGVAEQLNAGAVAATLAWIAGYPFDVLKTRCQMAGTAGTLSAAARDLYAEGGFMAFYRGLSLKLCRAVPMSTINFLAYEEAFRLLSARHTK